MSLTHEGRIKQLFMELETVASKYFPKDGPFRSYCLNAIGSTDCGPEVKVVGGSRRERGRMVVYEPGMYAWSGDSCDGYACLAPHRRVNFEELISIFHVPSYHRFEESVNDFIESAQYIIRNFNDLAFLEQLREVESLYNQLVAWAKEKLKKDQPIQNFTLFEIRGYLGMYIAAGIEKDGDVLEPGVYAGFGGWGPHGEPSDLNDVIQVVEGERYREFVKKARQLLAS